ncbi:MAG: hypothetical protein KF862_07125 [Chitinophagaceae bacterium]|nr:hypothetical protein [Chitinophagaceae bacterium]
MTQTTYSQEAIIEFNLSEEFRKRLFIERGTPVERKLTGKVSLTSDMRKELLRSCASVNYNKDVTEVIVDKLEKECGGWEYYYVESVDVATEINKYIAESANVAVARAEKLAKKEKELSEKIKANRDKFLGNYAAAVGAVTSQHDLDKETIDYIVYVHDSEKEKKVATNKAYVAKQEEERKVIMKAKESWGREHGSEYLINLIENDFDFLNQVDDEFLKKNYPGFIKYDIEYSACADAVEYIDEVKTPSEKILKGFIAVKKQYEDAALVAIKYEREEDYKTIKSKSFFAEIEAKLIGRGTQRMLKEL